MVGNSSTQNLCEFIDVTNRVLANGIAMDG